MPIQYLSLTTMDFEYAIGVANVLALNSGHRQRMVYRGGHYLYLMLPERLRR